MNKIEKIKVILRSGDKVKIKVVEKDSVIIISVNCSVLQEHVPVFKERLNSLIDLKKYWIVFDMNEASYLSSLGITVILDVKNRVKQYNGELALTNVNRLIKSLFDMTELTNQLTIYESNEEAITKLQKKIKRNANSKKAKKKS